MIRKIWKFTRTFQVSYCNWLGGIQQLGGGNKIVPTEHKYKIKIRNAQLEQQRSLLSQSMKPK